MFQKSTTVNKGAASSSIRPHDRSYEGIIWKLPHLLDYSYLELEEKNLEIKTKRLEGKSGDSMKKEFLAYLRKEKGIKAITVFFSDLEGCLHSLDYDKNYLVDAEENLTFDGSSIRGFTIQKESDLRLKIDWSSFRFAPADLFGAGKVLVFANICDKDGSFYQADFRSRLADLCEKLRLERGMSVYAAPEIEGFIFKNVRAEQHFDEQVGFQLATVSGYFNSLPQNTLRRFINKLAEAKRALGFQNEKDHPEVAPAQFELNFRYTPALDTADQILLYKLLARQIARSMELTACFLPKPIARLNGSGMHMNISLAEKGRNLFYDKNGTHSLSDLAYRFLLGILYYANDLCLIMNSSVNAYRRLDPKFEAPNEIKMSPVDRGSMIRIPIGNEKSARIEVRTVAPDVNPYLCLYALICAGLKGIDADEGQRKKMEDVTLKGPVRKLPGDIYSALEHYRRSELLKEIMGPENHQKYAELKTVAADRSPRSLGNKVKTGEVLYHHEVTNQLIWSDF